MNKLAIDIGKTFGSPFGGNLTEEGKSLGDLVSLGLRVAFVVAGIFILFALIYAGFKMVQGAGSSDQQAAQKSKQAATSAAIGFVVVFTAYWIIRIIEAITGLNFITNTP